MPREPRIYIEKVLYLVTAKVNDGRTLFCDVQDYASYLGLLSEYKREYGFKLFSFALMPKQLCLLVELSNDVTISTIMHNLNSRYTKSYNSRYGTKGHLFKSRFKSILIEKENYLLRLTRYIHALPKTVKINLENKNYSYSSYRTYLSTWRNRMSTLEMPEMYEEIREVFEHLKGRDEDEDFGRAYERYTNSADSQEMTVMQKLLHRTAFVGSKKFISEMRGEVETHVKEEEKARIVRKPNRVFVAAGSLIVLFLSFVAYSFYGEQTALQGTLKVATTSFELAQKDLAGRVDSLQGKITGLMELKYDGLNDAVWEIELSHVKGVDLGGAMTDKLSFKDGKLASVRLEEQGYTASEYSTTVKGNGEVVWQTVHVKPDGTKASWYGTWQDKKIRGILSERPAQGKGRDFSFVNVDGGAVK